MEAYDLKQATIAKFSTPGMGIHSPVTAKDLVEILQSIEDAEDEYQKAIDEDTKDIGADDH